MTDPRNIAHDKKVQQEKKHHGEAISPESDHTPQPGKKPHLKSHASDEPKADSVGDDTGAGSSKG